MIPGGALKFNDWLVTSGAAGGSLGYPQRSAEYRPLWGLVGVIISNPPLEDSPQYGFATPNSKPGSWISCGPVPGALTRGWALGKIAPLIGEGVGAFDR